MKMKLAAIVALGLVATAELTAKGTTVKLVVSGADLAAPVEITRDVQFANPWGDAFVHSWIPIPAPPAERKRYRVDFYEELGSRDVKMMYVVDYVPSPFGRGAIHLPGRREEHYRLNVSTIFRDGHDGQWFTASDDWERVVGSRVSGR
jgi:hypothetical protein